MTPLLKGIHDGYINYLSWILQFIFSRKKLRKQKLTSWRRFIFSKLWKYGAYCKVENVHHENKRFGKVCMNREWNSREWSFQKFKGVINFNSLRKRFILLNQMNKKSHHWKIFGNEKSIKNGKSKKNIGHLEQKLK
jgi:hypothetical protein